ncbi:MAG: hypothetical protein IPJ18_19940 [Betaproteobacteria bacterium]|nr:hypothetical protein [Betaproteobacteria bacterium]
MPSRRRTMVAVCGGVRPVAVDDDPGLGHGADVSLPGTEIAPRLRRVGGLGEFFVGLGKGAA